MEQLSPQDEMQVNQYLAKEFIKSHLAVKPSQKNVQALAKFIFQLEHSTD
jgi:hypothetical protein